MPWFFPANFSPDAAVVLVFTMIILVIGRFLVKSSLREASQRQQLELLTKKLETLHEQFKALNQARAEFISIASHQLRTPPATIKWYLAGILGGDFGAVSEKVKKALHKTQTTNNSMISLIDDLLNASRIERGKMEFLFEPVNIEKLVSITVEQLMPQAEDKKLKLLYAKPKKNIPVLTADKEKIRQVINNLLDNAIKYTKQGSVTARLEVKGKEVWFKVIDTGKGIDPLHTQNIFDKYSRGQDAATHATGLGLGLYVAKVIMEQHKGKIWAESPGEGQGSTFIFSLPIKSDLKPSGSWDMTKKSE